MQLAEDLGLKVERRPIAEEELATFEEAGACGTAAVISPIQRIDDPEKARAMCSAKMASQVLSVRCSTTSFVVYNTASNRMYTVGQR